MDQKSILAAILGAFIMAAAAFLIQVTTDVSFLLLSEEMKEEIATHLIEDVIVQELIIDEVEYEINRKIGIYTGCYSVSEPCQNKDMSIAPVGRGWYVITFNKAFDELPNIHITPKHGFGTATNNSNWPLTASIAEVVDNRTVRIKINLSQANTSDDGTVISNHSMKGYDTGFWITAIMKR